MNNSHKFKIRDCRNANAEMRSMLEALRVAVEDTLIFTIEQSRSKDLMLRHCVMFHFESDKNSEFISRVLLDGTVAIDSQSETYYLKFKDIAVDLLINILEELECGRYISMYVDLPLPTGILPAP